MGIVLDAIVLVPDTTSIGPITFARTALA